MTDTAVVTGADAGLGRAVALAFAEEGATVVLGGRDVEALEPVEAALEAAGGTAVALRSDARDEFDHERLMETAAREAGPIDVLVPTESVVHDAEGRHALPAVSYSAFDDVLRTNLRGPFAAIREAVPHLASDAAVLLPLPETPADATAQSRPATIAASAGRGLVAVAAADLDQVVVGVEHRVSLGEQTAERPAEPTAAARDGQPTADSQDRTELERVAAALLAARNRPALDGSVVPVSELAAEEHG